MDPEPPQPSESGSKSSRLVGTTSNSWLIATQQECRHQLVYRNAANAATKRMMLDSHSNIILKAGSSKNWKQLIVGCEYIHIEVNGCQVTIHRTASICRELRDLFMAARHRKSPWSTMAFVHKVCTIEHHDVFRSGIFMDEFPDTDTNKRTKQASITLEEATEAYIVDGIAESRCHKQQLISCRFPTSVQVWQGKEVGYSRSSPTCTCPSIWPKWPKEGVRPPQ